MNSKVVDRDEKGSPNYHFSIQVTRVASSYPSVVYPHTYTNISGNIIKLNLRTSMNERTYFFIKIYLSHFILERVDASVVCERWVERYILRERNSCYNIFFQEPGGANACTLLQARQTRLWSTACPSFDCDSLYSVQIWSRGSHYVVSFRLHTYST